MQSGSNGEKLIKLTFERAINATALSNFSCGIDAIDDFIHSELQEYVYMGSCQLYLIKDGGEIVAMYCLDRHNLHLSDSVKEMMHEGAKDESMHCDFVTVRALKHDGYTAVPFYQKCGFFPAEQEQEGRNLFMYRIVIR